MAKTNLGTFWLKIEQFWPFEEIFIFSNGGHLGYRTVLTDTILKGDQLRIISAKFGWDWLNSKISSKGQNCSILSQKVPKFELYKHNDELFNIYYGIFYELWNFTDFDRLCKLEKRGGSKFIKNPVIYVKKLIIMLIKFKFGHFLA
jgi:hypothetical protein